MTPEEQEEHNILKLATAQGKFALMVGHTFGTLPAHEAFERLQARRWISLIDVTPIASMDGVFRIFLASDEAMTWFRRQG